MSRQPPATTSRLQPAAGAAKRPPVPARYESLVRPLLIGLAAVLLALAFAHLGSEILDRETETFDMSVLHRAQTLRTDHPWISDVMRDISGLGSTTVLTLFTVATVGYLLLIAVRITALVLGSAVIAGSVLVSVFKAAFGRLRPDPAFAELVAQGLSFPSGHASMAAIVFLTIGALTASTRARLAERMFILGTAAVFTLLVGLSRVALGVHWATDVLGGWTYGTAWALAWLLIARRLSRRGASA